jgi:hypothetical protein
MRITRQTKTELVVKDNLLWLSAIFIIGGLVCVRATVLSGDRLSLIGVGLLLLFALICLQQSTFVFDGVRRTVTWRVLRFFKTSTGSLGFDAIQDVAIEMTASGSRQASEARVSLR